MNDLFSLVLFVALFFVMMRFGCGAHGSHGHRPESGGDKAQECHDSHAPFTRL